MNADGNVIKIKHDVLFEVAKLAFAGELEEQRDHLPLKLIPGPTPQFRCCIYKEREIIRQRIRLAEGKAPGPEDDGNIIQVISSACEDCPISSYTVTENCQNCLGKACINACKFGAIEPGHYRSHKASMESTAGSVVFSVASPAGCQSEANTLDVVVCPARAGSARRTANAHS